MAYNLEEFNIVILASSNNPSILNPDFLRATKIIEEGFKPTTEVISTPAFSHIKYEEKIAITVDPDRITIVDVDENRIPNDSPIPSIAINYINVLPHVQYSAVGFNFRGYRESAEIAPAKFIMDKFIKEGPWSNYSGMEPSTSLTLAYQADDYKMNLNIAPAKTTKDGKSFDSISLKSNIHCEPKEKGIEIISTYIKNWKQYFDDIQKLLGAIFE